MSGILFDVGDGPTILEAIGPPSFPLLKRIAGGYDEVVHSLVFEFVDGERRGLCLDEKNEPLSVMDDANIARRIRSDWANVEYGDYIIAVSGFNSNRNEFLCHSVTLLFKSGSKITYQSNKVSSKGDRFHITLPPTKLLTNLVFLTNGTMPAVGVKTTSIHLPITKEYISLLPKMYRQRIIKLFMTLNRILLKVGENKEIYNSITYDIYWSIISYICGYHLEE